MYFKPHLCLFDPLWWICYFIFRKQSLLSLRSFKPSPSTPRKHVRESLLSLQRSTNVVKTSNRRKSIIKFLRKSSIFNKDKGVTETEDNPTSEPRSFLGQIYKNAKIKLSKSLASVSQVSSCVFKVTNKHQRFKTAENSSLPALNKA